jgi:light-regulated signal transduction histidine kinase (bacteriophytochrome)
MANRLGVNVKECSGQKCYELIHGTTEPPLDCPHINMLKDWQEHTLEIYEDNLNGYFINSASPLYNEKKELIGSVHVLHDINNRKKADKKLKNSMNELKRSNQELEQFAYIASHDLQEPLRMVSSFTQLLEKQYKDKLDENALEYINYAVDGAKRMQVLIKDLLAYSRVNTKGDEFENVYLDKVLDEVFLNLELIIEENHAVITCESLPMICADYWQMVQLFQNIIVNALKYRSKETPKIQISAKKLDKEWLFSVEDNGIGIDSKYSNRIFMIFKRLHTNEEYEGTGIGLAIAERIIRRHGGRIWVESEPGKGSTFYFTIPNT